MRLGSPEPATTQQPTGWVCACCGTPGRLGTPCQHCGAHAYRTDTTPTRKEAA